MTSALIAAAYIIELGIENHDPVTNMKLQKLVYLSNGIHLARHDTPMFNEDVEAWSYGPVIRSVYDAFKHLGTKPITEIPSIELRLGGNLVASHVDMLAESEKEAINLAWEIGGLLSGTQLSTWSHSEGSPWALTFTHGISKKIRPDVMKPYFRKLLKINQ